MLPTNQLISSITKLVLTGEPELSGWARGSATWAQSTSALVCSCQRRLSEWAILRHGHVAQVCPSGIDFAIPLLRLGGGGLAQGI